MAEIVPTDRPIAKFSMQFIEAWLDRWEPWITAQIPVPLVTLTAARIEAETALTPADERAATLALAELFRWARLFGLKLDDLEATAREFREALADLPADLLTQAIGMIRRTWHYPSLPLPGDLRRQVTDELARRRMLATKLRQAEARRREQADLPPKASPGKMPEAWERLTRSNEPTTAAPPGPTSPDI